MFYEKNICLRKKYVDMFYVKISGAPIFPYLFLFGIPIVPLLGSISFYSESLGDDCS